MPTKSDTVQGIMAVMDDSRQAIDRRLARIEGQVRGVRRLMAEDAYCCDVLNQVNAVASALNQVKAQLAGHHIRRCVIGHGSESAHHATRIMSREEILDELDDVLKTIVR